MLYQVSQGISLVLVIFKESAISTNNVHIPAINKEFALMGSACAKIPQEKHQHAFQIDCFKKPQSNDKLEPGNLWTVLKIPFLTQSRRNAKHALKCYPAHHVTMRGALHAMMGAIQSVEDAIDLYPNKSHLFYPI